MVPNCLHKPRALHVQKQSSAAHKYSALGGAIVCQAGMQLDHFVEAVHKGG